MLLKNLTVFGTFFLPPPRHLYPKKVGLKLTHKSTCNRIKSPYFPLKHKIIDLLY